MYPMHRPRGRRAGGGVLSPREGASAALSAEGTHATAVGQPRRAASARRTETTTARSESADPRARPRTAATAATEESVTSRRGA